MTTNTSYAGFWIRACAFLIDSTILVVALSFLLVIVPGGAGFSHFTRIADPSFFMQQMVHNFFSAVVCWLYFSLCESSTWQATIGKKLLGIKVTDDAGNKLTFARATGRHFGKILSTFFFCIGYIMAAFTSKKQSLHDILASTLVVRE